MIDQIEKVAIRSRAPVLLTGPTGAGKSQLAKRIYELKKAQRQVSGDFIEVNCATLRGDQAMSTLFGHVKGAFTGAQAERAGLMKKSADKGVLFLGEIGELGLGEQAMCLRAIEEKRFLLVGADRDTTSNFQLLAGTNRDLSSSVREGRFREDLFARLNLWTFNLPALKDRKEDIEPNLEFELRRHGREGGSERHVQQRGGRPIYGLPWRRRPRGAPTSATSPHPSREWRLSRRKAASTRRPFETRSHGSGTCGRERGEPNRKTTRCAISWAPSDCRRRPVRACATGNRRCGLQARKFLSAAGRELFAASRRSKTSSNDADRLRKYLARFGRIRFDRRLGEQ